MNASGRAINLLLPHQLVRQHELLKNGLPVYLLEETLFFHEFNFHQHKLAWQRAAMQSYAAELRRRGLEVVYVEAHDPCCDCRQWLRDCAAQGIGLIHYINPTDNWLQRRLRNSARKLGIALLEYESALFLNTRAELDDFFGRENKRYLQARFYQQQRQQRQILLDSQGQPSGGKWSFDSENRKKYPARSTPPEVLSPPADRFWEEACNYVRQHFADNPGTLPAHPLFPYDFAQSDDWFAQFLEYRFHEFGVYEDAMLQGSVFLHHSAISPLLNVGLLSPQQVLKLSLQFAEQQRVPLNSLEGFVRQVIGWREFVRGIYEAKGSAARRRNYWQFSRPIPRSFYTASTGIAPLDHVIQKVLDNAYCHHIERLMVLGNFMLLCEFDPDAVYRWFMELFIDSYDWVMVPNVYGMSQFADGGLFATKPYISGSNYILKMSDFKRGDWQAIWDGLFWRFMHVHRDFFLSNPRLGMLLKRFDQMSEVQQQQHLEQAESYLQQLDAEIHDNGGPYRSD